MERPLKIRLHIISPVHIGCDDVYEPTGFVIDEKKNKLISFEPMDFINSLSSDDRQRFVQICMKGSVSSIVEVYKFISGRQVKGREIEIARGILSHYKKVMNLPINEREIQQELNHFAISRTAYNPHTNFPYIPGSSLKGALRTAYLNKLAKERDLKRWNGKAKDLEIDLLGGSFDTDPFRMVKPSDFLPVGDAGIKIYYAVNKKKKTSKTEARGPFQILETIKPGATFEGLININQPETEAGIENPISTKELLIALRKFYVSLIEEEAKIIKEIGAASIISKINEQFRGKIGKSAFILRLGRHSGAEAVTIEGNRWIKIMQKKGDQPKSSEEGATTLWLASEESNPINNNGLLPFGWVVMEIM